VLVKLAPDGARRCPHQAPLWSDPQGELSRGKPGFLRFATSYWTLKLVQLDQPSEGRDTLAGHLLAQVELNVSGLFFPTRTAMAVQRVAEESGLSVNSSQASPTSTMSKSSCTGTPSFCAIRRLPHTAAWAPALHTDPRRWRRRLWRLGVLTQHCEDGVPGSGRDPRRSASLARPKTLRHGQRIFEFASRRDIDREHISLSSVQEFHASLLAELCGIPFRY
jgi:hypothetical protein